MLADSILSGDVTGVEQVIQGLSDPTYINKVNKRSGHTPLNLACLSGQCDIIDVLIQKGNANLINEDAKGRLPLHCAAESKNVKVVERIVYWLTNKPVAVNGNWLAKCMKMKDKRGWTGLHAAIFGANNCDSLIICQTLINSLPSDGTRVLSRGLYLCQPKSRDYPPVIGLLHKAILCGSDAMVKFLLLPESRRRIGLPEDISEILSDKDQNGRTALMLACCEGLGSTTSLLLEYGADARATDNDGQTAAHWAFAMGHVRVGDILMQSISELNNMVDCEGLTPKDWRIKAVANELDVDDEEDNLNGVAHPQSSRIDSNKNESKKEEFVVPAKKEDRVVHSQSSKIDSKKDEYAAPAKKRDRVVHSQSNRIDSNIDESKNDERMEPAEKLQESDKHGSEKAAYIKPYRQQHVQNVPHGLSHRNHMSNASIPPNIPLEGPVTSRFRPSNIESGGAPLDMDSHATIRTSRRQHSSSDKRDEESEKNSASSASAIRTKMNNNSARSKAKERRLGAGGGVEGATTTSWQSDRAALESAMAADAKLLGFDVDDNTAKEIRTHMEKMEM